MTASAGEPLDSVATQSLQEVVVTGLSARQRVSSGHLGSENLELTKLAMTPQLFGETDIIKSITLLPGVHGEADGAGGFEVRGGNAYQNLVTVDGMTLYNPSHMMGIFSTFNDDAMSRATLHKGPIPARFGGASSSALETSMKAGDMTRYNFSGTIGILNAKASADGPIVKDRLSFAVAARRSYVDMFLKMIPEYRHTVMNFMDINAKLRYVAGAGDIIDLSFFASRDNLAISNLMAMHWGNVAGSLNWQAHSGDSWRFVTTAAATDYSTDMSMDIMDSDQRMKQYIRNFSLNERVNVGLGEEHEMELGLRSELLRVKSGDMRVNASRQFEIRSGWQNALWAGYEGTFAHKVALSLGLRASAFSVMSGDRFHDFSAIQDDTPDFSSKTYFDLEPRGSVRYDIGERHNVRIGFSMTSQNLHGIRATSTTFPFDRYAITSANVRPERTAQYSAGYAGMTPDGAFDWSAEIYYKSMRNVYDYADGMSMFSRINLESIILGGKGRSRGMELMLRKNTGRLTGWLSYTLSATDTRIPGINDGRWYKASNDRRHDIAMVGIYSLNDKWRLSASWTYSSGRPITAPDAKYELSGTTCYYYSERNGYMTPASHRLDISATYTRIGRHATTIWSFGLFNAYARYSPFVIYFEDDDTKPSGTRAVQQSLFGIVPSVSYTIKF
ncbi:MAG: TonB-dependent receptor plug domain-containing protein [Bacteroidales bacterium]|nr:TonB-dependent receptor plug domain-containing protein [Bacteroidales bacterium]